MGSSLANIETTYTFSIILPTAIGIGNVLKTEFPSDITINPGSTITNVACLGGPVARDSPQIIRVETSQICNPGLISMDITAVKNPVYILSLLCNRMKLAIQETR